VTQRRIICNDDFRTIMSHDQCKFHYPASADDLASLVGRVRGTGVTTYVMDSIEYDNKVYFATERGIDWAKLDFTKFGADWSSHFGEDWDDHYGAATRLMLEMREQGREPLQVVIDTCRDMGMEVLAGIRMNDCHGLVPLANDDPDISVFLKANPEHAFCFPGTDERTRLADYSHEAVRDYRFAVLQELMEKFDFDGIELNWMRWPFLFQPDEVRGGPFGYITEQRFAELAPIMTQWTARIRQMLDELASKKGKAPMVMGVRVPETPDIARAVGIDLPAWIRQARLDYIVPSGYHSTNFNIPVGQFKAICQATDCAVYPSLFPNVANVTKSVRAYQTEVYAAAAQTYYGGGADGVQVFNHFHPSCKVIGLPFNAEALNVIASPQAVADHPIHHSYIVYSAQPTDVPDVARMYYTGFRGTNLSESRRSFAFRFGDDLASARRKLTRLRFKIFDMTEEDGAPKVWLNDTQLNYDRQWRQRFVYKNMHIDASDEDLDDQTVNWRRAGNYADLEHLSGVPVGDADRELVLELLGKPIWRRPEWLKMYTGKGDGRGRDIFMLVDADVSSISSSVLHQGLNRLWVQLGERREDFMFDLYMGELEIVTTLS
jgi:hypothetical protein